MDGRKDAGSVTIAIEGRAAIEERQTEIIVFVLGESYVHLYKYLNQLMEQHGIKQHENVYI